MPSQCSYRWLIGLGRRAIVATFALPLAGCGARAAVGATSAPAPQAASTPASAPAMEGASYQAEADMAGLRTQVAAPPPGAPPQPSMPGAAPVPKDAEESASESASPVVRREMLDISAQIAMRVQNLKQALNKLREAVPRYSGTITRENVNDGGGPRTATLTIRVDSAKVEAFFAELERLGDITQRQVTAQDVSKAYHDAEILLHNLEVTLRRYEEILAKANTVQEVLTIEQHLSRVRGEIESVKGNLRFMRDRAARATVNLTIQEPVSELTTVEPELEPEAKFYPGLRLSYLADFRGGDGDDDAQYFGGGASVRWSRGIGIDVHGLRREGSDNKGLDVFMLTLGGELYSDLLGGGKRRWFNPYLGFRLGYARFTGEDEALAGVTLGTEILKTKVLVVDLEARALGFFFGGDGSHVGLQPSLAASVAF